METMQSATHLTPRSLQRLALFLVPALLTTLLVCVQLAHAAHPAHSPAGSPHRHAHRVTVPQALQESVLSTIESVRHGVPAAALALCQLLAVLTGALLFAKSFRAVLLARVPGTAPRPPSSVSGRGARQARPLAFFQRFRN